MDTTGEVFLGHRGRRLLHERLGHVDPRVAGYAVPTVCLVGGTVAFPGFAEVVEQASGLPTVVPVSPLFVTPLGIARSAPVHEPAPGFAQQRGRT